MVCTLDLNFPVQYFVKDTYRADPSHQEHSTTGHSRSYNISTGQHELKDTGTDQEITKIYIYVPKYLIFGSLGRCFFPLRAGYYTITRAGVKCDIFFSVNVRTNTSREKAHVTSEGYVCDTWRVTVSRPARGGHTGCSLKTPPPLSVTVGCYWWCRYYCCLSVSIVILAAIDET